MAGKGSEEHREAERMRDDVPSTVARSDDKAVVTYKKTLESAEEQYDSASRAHRTAFASLKHTHEKVGDHWEPKDENGPSDAQAEQSGADARDRPKQTAGGVDANASKEHLEGVAKKLGISDPGHIRKDDLVEEIRKANDRETARARED